MATRTYNPTVDELNKAIAGYLAKDYHNPKDIHAHLKKDHSDWHLPERRVAKFTKRLKAGTPISDADEEKSVMSQRSGGSLGRLFSSRKAVEDAPTAPPTPEKLPENISVAKTEDTPETEMEPKDLEPAYADDNDGKKEMGCWFCTF